MTPDFGFFGPIDITNPPPGSSAPPTVTLSTDCTFGVTVNIDTNLVHQVLAISWSINGASGSIDITTGSSGAYTFTAGPAISGTTNTINVSLSYVDANAVQQSAAAARLFTATGGGSSCQSSSSSHGNQVATSPSVPIGVPLPRFYKLALFGPSLQSPRSTENMLCGGLLERSAVYLEYDVGLSTPAIAVWKDINLPDMIGKWTLRVGRQGCRLRGDLTLFRLTQSEVSPPSQFGTSDWNVRGDNVLRSTGQPGSFVDFASRHDLIIVVSPA